MPEIIVLPKEISDLIAAGEVVERPASVIKELIENSIDAGADKITVEIMNGGITFMRVTDNGCGISEKDIRNAFLSHATSKIKSVDDLDSIYTLGFRGEALASVSAVSKVDVLTKTKESENGIHYCIEGSQEICFEESGCPDGTTIVVCDLFYNTPARMKFLKKDVSEGNYVAAVVERIALSHPEISFRFIRDGKQTVITSGNGDLLSTVYSVLGKEFSSSLIPVDYEVDGVKVSGYISKPSCCRATRSMQFFYLNSRYIKSTTASAALEQAYKNSIMVGKFPSCVMNIEIDASAVDVNVHPTKTEVRFSNDRLIFNAVYYGALNSINNCDTRVKADITRPAKKTFQSSQSHYSQIKMEARPKKDFWVNLTGEELVQSSSRLSDSAKEMFVRKQPEDKYSLLNDYYKKREKEDRNISVNTDLSDNRQAYADRTEDIKDDILPDKRQSQSLNGDKNSSKNDSILRFIDEENDRDEVRVIGEAFKTYIFAEIGNKLYIIDKHAAHERIIFNRLKKNEIASQFLFTPVTVSLSVSEYTAILENTDLLEKAGYSVEDFGIGKIVVRECPSQISADDIPSQIYEIAGYLVMNKTDIETEKIDWIYHSAACRAAVKAGDTTTEYEQQKFVEMLLSDESIRYCPHGRPVLIEMTKSELEKQFGRLQ